MSDEQQALPAESEIFSIIGEGGFQQLVAAFYRQVPGDEILEPMYPAEDMEGAEQRLRDFLIFRFGGPETYLADRGHPRLRARHAPFPIDHAARDRWVRNMNIALDEAQFPAGVAEVLRNFFAGVATFLINRAPVIERD